MALAWIFRDQAVTSVIVGASKKEQILDNIGALRNMPFTEEEIKAIDAIAKKA